MQCARRPLIPWERAWQVLEQQRGQCGWSWERGESVEMMVEVKMGPVHVGPCRWLMGCHWRVLAKEWESLNIQMANGQTMYKSRTLTPNCSNLPRKQACQTITSPGSCLLEVRRLSLLTIQKATFVTIVPNWSGFDLELTVSITFVTVSNLEPARKSQTCPLTNHKVCPAFSEPSDSFSGSPVFFFPL